MNEPNEPLFTAGHWRKLRESIDRLDALGAGVGHLLAVEPWRAEGRGEAERRLPVEPERSAGGIGHPGCGAGRCDQAERLAALGR